MIQREYKDDHIIKLLLTEIKEFSDVRLFL